MSGVVELLRRPERERERERERLRRERESERERERVREKLTAAITDRAARANKQNRNCIIVIYNNSYGG